MTPRPPGSDAPLPLSALDFHVLLVLSREDLYGYAVMKAVEEHSVGAVVPEIGSLYRVLGRLMHQGLVEEAGHPDGAPQVHRGRPRKYYRITPSGLATARAEAERLDRALALARNLLPGAPQG